jgi:hypothetical protein
MIKNLLLLAALWYLGDMVAYACQTVIIDTPKGSQVCFICSDGRYVNCSPL